MVRQGTACAPGDAMCPHVPSLAACVSRLLVDPCDLMRCRGVHLTSKLLVPSMGSPRWQKVLRRRPWLLCSTCVALAVSGKAFTAQSLRKEGMASHPTGPTGFAGRRDLEVSVLAEAEGTESGASVDVALATPERSRAVQVWSVLGVAAYLSYGVKKVVPIVHQGLASITAPWQWLLLVATTLSLLMRAFLLL